MPRRIPVLTRFSPVSQYLLERAAGVWDATTRALASPCVQSVHGTGVLTPRFFFFLRSQCTDSNPIVFCDGCDIGVHKCCYGIRDIPEGDWLCRKCSTKGGHRGGPV